MNEAALVRNCKRGNKKALYQHFFPYAMGIAIRYSPDYDQALEIVNDSFLQAFKSIQKLNDSNFRGWLGRRVINSAVDFCRKEDNYFPNEPAAAITHEFKDGEVSVSRLSYEELLSSLQNLPLFYRIVFNLYAIDEYKHDEISKMLEISIVASKTILSQARGILKELISEKESVL